MRMPMEVWRGVYAARVTLSITHWIYASSRMTLTLVRFAKWSLFEIIVWVFFVVWVKKEAQESYEEVVWVDVTEGSKVRADKNSSAVMESKSTSGAISTGGPLPLFGQLMVVVGRNMLHVSGGWSANLKISSSIQRNSNMTAQLCDQILE